MDHFNTIDELIKELQEGRCVVLRAHDSIEN